MEIDIENMCEESIKKANEIIVDSAKKQVDAYLALTQRFCFQIEDMQKRIGVLEEICKDK